MARLPALASTLVALALAGCSPSGMMDTVMRAGADVRPVQLQNVERDLAPFTADERYDYLVVPGDAGEGGEPEVEAAAEYMVIGERRFDDVFYRSAVLAGQFHQVSETMARYRDGRLDLSDSEDAEFLALMAVVGVETLPNMVTEARSLAESARALDMGGLSTRQRLQAGQGVALALANLNAIIDNREQVDAMLNDYGSLVDDLDAIEAGG